jgi:hypothetical protein
MKQEFEEMVMANFKKLSPEFALENYDYAIKYTN